MTNPDPGPISKLDALIALHTSRIPIVKLITYVGKICSALVYPSAQKRKNENMSLILQIQYPKKRQKIPFWLKGIVQPFEVGDETRLIRFAVKYWKPDKFIFYFLMIQSPARSIDHFQQLKDF